MELKEKILNAAGDELIHIDKALKDNLTPHLELVRQVAGHVLFAGGKRLRPLLMVLAARICGHQGRDAATYSVIFEYLHTATLLHDDVVDGANLRRGQPVAHQVWDPPTAVLTGDYLLARSLTLATRTGKPEVVHAIAAITEDMAQGELRQLVYKGDLTLTEEAYREVIRSKTAVLFQAACRVGALIADAPSSQVQAIGEYGFELGMAFQMADDLLDYLQDTSVLGKTMGADLREGKLTLPVIHALQHVVGEQKQWMSDLIQKRTFSTVEFQRLMELLKSRGSIDYTRQCARSHVMAANSALNAFGPSSMRSLLQDVAEYAAARAM
jgi:octaprenyl-diphosphate synthase